MRKITPATGPLNIDLKVPGDKSISHRSLIFAALAKGTSQLTHLGTGADIRSTANVLRQLGVQIEPGEQLEVHSDGLAGFCQADAELDVGNSGTTIRLMAGLLSGRPFQSVLTGDESIRQRPMKRIIDPLTTMGAHITGTSEHTAPLIIEPAELHGIDYIMPVASAQVKSAIILAGLQVRDGTTIVREQTISRRHTEIMLQNLGAPVRVEGPVITVEPMPEPLNPFDIAVPGDPSSAAFWAAAAAMVPGSRCRVRDICLSPERIAFFHQLRAMGTEVRFEVWDETLEPRGDVFIEYQSLHGITITESDVPALVDEIPLLAVLGAFAEGETSIRGAEELRFKECDRIAATVRNLQALGVETEEFQDGLKIAGGKKPAGADLESFGDHRVAMAFAVAGLGAGSESAILHPEAASVSYPEFWNVFARITEEQ